MELMHYSSGLNTHLSENHSDVGIVSPTKQTCAPTYCEIQGQTHMKTGQIKVYIRVYPASVALWVAAAARGDARPLLIVMVKMKQSLFALCD